MVLCCPNGRSGTGGRGGKAGGTRTGQNAASPRVNARTAVFPFCLRVSSRSLAHPCSAEGAVEPEAGAR